MGYEKICRRLMEIGTLAPSLYNSQPWAFLADSKRGTLSLHPDTRKVRVLGIDPQERELYLALGACWESVSLAAPGLGFEIREEIFPETGIAARGTLKPLSEAIQQPLFPALFNRHSHAGKFAGEVEAVQLDRLWNLFEPLGEERLYVVTEPAPREALQGLLHDLSHEGSQQAPLVEEAARWVTPRSKAPEGLPFGFLGLPISVRVRFSLLRYFNPSGEIREVARQTLLRQGHGIEAPAFLCVTTRRPNPAGYFQCGRQWLKLSLTLHEIDLSSQTLHLPLTLTSFHEKLKELFNAKEGETPALLMRFGKPLKSQWPSTSRRQVEECLLPG